MMSNENTDNPQDEPQELTEADLNSTSGGARDAAGNVGHKSELGDRDLASVVGGAGVDYFLKIDGIDGESTDDKHKGEIQLESYSQGIKKSS